MKLYNNNNNNNNNDNDICNNEKNNDTNNDNYDDNWAFRTWLPPGANLHISYAWQLYTSFVFINKCMRTYTRACLCTYIHT